jgi:mRNA interferase HigB
MRVISKRALHRFWQRHPQAEQALLAWHREMTKRDYATPVDLRRTFPTVDFVAGDRAIFNIGGNRYRLIVEINYRSQCAFVRFIGTHGEYDRIDARTVKEY